VARLEFKVKPVRGVEVGAFTSHCSGSDQMDRAACADLIAALNPHLPPPDPGARYVIAGQQPGLLTGPLYTFLKAASAVALAARIGALPLFWIASEDHDVLEVNRVTLFGKRFVQPYEGEIRRGRVPQVADIALEKAPLLDFMKEVLPDTEFKPWILDAVQGADFSSYASAFADLMRFLLDEWKLRLVDPLSLRNLTAPVLADLVDRWPEMTAAFEKNGPLDSIGLFEIKGGMRVPVEVPDGNAVRARPDAYSAGAGLRPLLQDAVLPVIATIAGPTEIEYLKQIRPLYEVGGITPSLLHPRISATYVESKILSAARKAGLDEFSLFETERREVTDPEMDGIREKEKMLVREILEVGEGSDARWLKKSMTALRAQVDRIVRRLQEERKTEAALNRGRLEKVAQALTPGGKRQERVVNVFQFLDLYGPDFVRLTVERLDPLGLEHQVVFMETLKE
jgi:uncharacterized protein YllA (UPF0747 family)